MERLGAEGDALADHQPLHLSSTALCCEAYLQLMFMVTFVLPLLTFFFFLETVSVLVLAHKGVLIAILLVSDILKMV